MSGKGKGHQRWRLLVPLILVVGVVLNRTGLVQGGVAVVVALGVLEAFFVLYVGVMVIRLVRASRRRSVTNSGQQGGAYGAVVAALQEVFPSGVARFLAMEPFLYRDLVRWPLRRRPRQEGQLFSYAGSPTWRMLLALLLLITPVEVLLLELLIPWSWLRIVFLVLALWTLVYILGLYASMRLRPHQVTDDGLLRLRYGHFFAADIPVSLIEETSTLRYGVRVPRRGLGLVLGAEGTAYLPGTEEPRVTLTLRWPVPMGSVGTEPTAVRHLNLYVDDPQGFVEALKGCLARS